MKHCLYIELLASQDFLFLSGFTGKDDSLIMLQRIIKEINLGINIDPYYKEIKWNNNVNYSCIHELYYSIRTE